MHKPTPLLFKKIDTSRNFESKRLKFQKISALPFVQKQFSNPSISSLQKNIEQEQMLLKKMIDDTKKLKPSLESETMARKIMEPVKSSTPHMLSAFRSQYDSVNYPIDRKEMQSRIQILTGNPEPINNNDIEILIQLEKKYLPNELRTFSIAIKNNSIKLAELTKNKLLEFMLKFIQSTNYYSAKLHFLENDLDGIIEPEYSEAFSACDGIHTTGAVKPTPLNRSQQLIKQENAAVEQWLLNDFLLHDMRKAIEDDTERYYSEEHEAEIERHLEKSRLASQDKAQSKLYSESASDSDEDESLGDEEDSEDLAASIQGSSSAALTFAFSSAQPRLQCSLVFQTETPHTASHPLSASCSISDLTSNPNPAQKLFSTSG